MKSSGAGVRGPRRPLPPSLLLQADDGACVGFEGKAELAVDDGVAEVVDNLRAFGLFDIEFE